MNDIIELLAIVFLAIVVGICFGIIINTNDFEHRAVKAGVGYYNPTNAQFHFITVTNN